MQREWHPELGTAIRSLQSEGGIEGGMGGAQWGGGGGGGGRGGVTTRETSGELERGGGPLKRLVDLIQVRDRQTFVGLFCFFIGLFLGFI